MPIPHIYAPVKPSDFTLIPVQVNKKYTVLRSQLYSGSIPITGSGYKILEAIYPDEPLKLYTRKTYPTNSFDGSYKNLVWKQLDAMYYRNPHDRFSAAESTNPRYNYKFLNYSASLFQIPQHNFGDGVLPGSVEFTGSGFNLKDDGNGNLYDTGLVETDFASPSNLIARWNPHDAYRDFDVNLYFLSTPYTDSGRIEYKSNQFSDNTFSSFNEVAFAQLENIGEPPSDTLGKMVWMLYNGSGHNTSYMMTENRDELNFPDSTDFTISFWVWVSDDPGTGAEVDIISKYGVVSKLNDNGLLPASQSYSNTYTNVYPYRFSMELVNDRLVFRRSDGINVTEITSNFSVRDGTSHIALVKTGSECSLYIGGVLNGSATDNTQGAVNRHALMFGAANTASSRSCYCALNEIRFYNKALSTSQITALSTDNTLAFMQTSVVGNVFYKQGKVVLTPHDNTYKNLLNSDFTLKYRNTHTIYQYECMVRIRPGDFNLSLNPSARKSPYSDLLIDAMTGSMDEGALMPYATEIGLYNDKAELVVVGKLGQPLQMRDDVPINVCVRFDA